MLAASFIVCCNWMQRFPMSEAGCPVPPRLASWLQLVARASAPTASGAQLSEEKNPLQEAWRRAGTVSCR